MSQPWWCPCARVGGLSPSSRVPKSLVIMVAFGLPYSWQQPCASHPCPASMERRGPSQTAGLVGRAPDTAYVVYHMSYCHEMSVCQNCFLLVACGKLGSRLDDSDYAPSRTATEASATSGSTSDSNSDPSPNSPVTLPVTLTLTPSLIVTLPVTLTPTRPRGSHGRPWWGATHMCNLS